MRLLAAYEAAHKATVTVKSLSGQRLSLMQSGLRGTVVGWLITEGVMSVK